MGSFARVLPESRQSGLALVGGRAAVAIPLREELRALLWDSHLQRQQQLQRIENAEERQLFLIALTLDLQFELANNMLVSRTQTPLINPGPGSAPEQGK